MQKIENELDELIYEQYGDKLDVKDKEIEIMHKKRKPKTKKWKP